jgi:glycosyltransferase involved in cell wall biosynthesis
MDLSLVAPAYNEENIIESVVMEWLTVLHIAVENEILETFEIIVCDDKSQDSTLRILKQLSFDHPELKIISNPVNMGAGFSLQKAIKSSTGEWVLLLDSDGQFNPNDFTRMFLLKDGFQGVFGIRKSKKSTFIHKIGSKVATMISKLLFSVNLEDFNCQLKVINGDVLRSFRLRSLRMNYSGEITILSVLSGIHIRWVEVDHLQRRTGKSNTKFIQDGFSRLFFLLFIALENRLIEKKIIENYGGLHRED